MLKKKNSSKRPKSSYHLVLIPNRSDSVHRVRMSAWQLRGLVCLAVGLVLGLAVTGSGYLRYQRLYQQTQADRSDLAQVQQKQVRLSQRLIQLEETVNRAETVVSRVDALVTPHLNNTMQGMGPIEGRGHLAVGDSEKLKSLSKLDTEAFAVKFEGLSDSLTHRSLTVEQQVTALYQQYQDRMIRLSSTPNLWPTMGWTTSRFGLRHSPFTGRTKFHEGLDIAAPWGTVVKAAGAGRVSYAGYRGGLGKTVIIDHGFGYQTVYGHNSKLIVSAGDRVEGGQAISAVGNTGHSTGPHLHFEVHVDGVPVDPMNYLPPRIEPKRFQTANVKR